MKILCTSDLHGQLPTDLPDSDVIVIAGDVCPDMSYDMGRNVELQRNWLLSTFTPWVASLKRSVVMTWGNHDWVGQIQSDIEDAILNNLDTSTHSFDILKDTSAALQNPDTGDMVYFYGTPWTPQFGYWAFMRKDAELDEVFAEIPKKLDVLISHGPPYAHCDRTDDSRLAGSKSLAKHVKRAKPRYVICGHIHEGRGAARLGGHTSVFNVSYLSLEYKPYMNLMLDQYEPRYRVIEI